MQLEGQGARGMLSSRDHTNVTEGSKATEMDNGATKNYFMHCDAEGSQRLHPFSLSHQYKLEVHSRLLYTV